MVRLTIDGQAVAVQEGATLLEAARACGIEIPVLCTLPGFEPEPTCLVCMVKNEMTGRLLPACAARAEDDMRVLTDTPEIKAARARVLDLLAAEHAGDCEAPCRRGCPLFIDVDRALQFLATGRVPEAVAVFLSHNPFPSLMGRLCDASCERVCRRGRTDGAVSIKTLEKYAGDRAGTRIPARAPATGKRVAVVGAGLDGLGAAYFLALAGHDVTIMEKESQPGGGLRTMYHNDADVLGALERETGRIARLGVRIIYDSVIGSAELKKLFAVYDGLVLACGGKPANYFTEAGLDVSATGVAVDRETFASSRPGVFAVGGAVREMRQAVHALREGRAAALALTRYLATGQTAPEKRPFDSHLSGLTAEELDEFLRTASPAPRNTGMMGDASGEEAAAEAARCFHCACRKRDDCAFRRVVTAHLPQRRVRLSGRPPFRRVDTHPAVTLEPGKCIKCGRCVRIGRARGEPLGLALIGRGFEMTIGVPFGRPLAEALTVAAADCVAACPTGALAWKAGAVS